MSATDGLVKRLDQIHRNDWRRAHLAHTSDTAKEAADKIAELVFGPAREYVQPCAPRDFEAHPYDAQERRVAAFLTKTAPDIGTGDDPIGFLLASYAYTINQRNDLRDALKRYGWHTDRCSAAYGGKTCTCGFTAAWTVS